MPNAVTRIALPVAAAGLLVGAMITAGPAGADTAPLRPSPNDAAVAGGYTALPPARILDTRPASGLAASSARTVTVAGKGGVPESGVAAVVVNLTVVAPQASGYLSAYPNPGKPTSSNLNFTAGRTIANLAVVPVASNGTIQLYNGSGGRSDVLVDVTGWFAPTVSVPTTDGGFRPVGPSRLLDTRNSAPVPAGGTVKLVVRGKAGVPAAAGAAVLNITAVTAAAAGYVTVYPGTSPRPTSSNLNIATGQTVAGLTAARLGTDGSVLIYNSSSRPLQVTVDVAGYFRGTSAAQSGNFSFLAPARVFDTRSGLGTARAQLAAGAARTIAVTGRAGIPTSGVAAVVLNVTATSTTASGYLTVYSGATRPTASTLNFNAGQTVPNLVIVPVTAGSIAVFNGSGRPVDVLADVAGFVRNSDLAVPGTSTSRYVNDLLTADSDGAIREKMFSHGQDDAVAIDDGSDRTVLLEFGAQSNKVPNADGGLSFGVLPPNTQGNSQRLTYAQVVTAVQGYLDGFQAGRGESADGVVTVAVGTSNDGYLGATYNPSDKGADWASEVVGPLVSYGSARDVTVVGANDIEPNFDGTAAEVRTWVSTFLAGNSLKLLNNGSAPACPSTLGQIRTTCQPVASDHAGSPAQQWSQADYVSFSRTAAPNRISVLPQIYSDVDAARWENISLTSAASGTGPLLFAGVLTQFGVCGASCSLAPSEAWVAMRQALDSSTVTAGTALKTVSDIVYNR